MDIEEQLKQIPLLKEIDQEELDKLALLVRKRRAVKGEHVIFAEDPEKSLMFIVEGQVKVSLVGDVGKEVILAYLGKGDFFGEMALLTGDTRSADVVAAADCTILSLSERDFEEHILENPGLSVALLKELAGRLRCASRKIGDLVLFDVYRRVARTLRSLAEEEECDGQKVLIVKKRPTHQELASLVGTSREMVTRALKELSEEGCIEIEGRRINIFDLPV